MQLEFEYKVVYFRVMKQCPVCGDGCMNLKMLKFIELYTERKKPNLPYDINKLWTSLLA